MFKNVWQAFSTSPVNRWKDWILSVVLFSVAAMVIGTTTHVYQFQTLNLVKFWFLPLTLFVFPCVLEELFFRGLLIHRDVLDHGSKRANLQIVFSAVTFTLWHPLNAWTINKSAQPFFFNPWFLLITLLLGLTCGYAYVRSRSLWTPILIHWLTVLVWVLFLGGRNLVLD
ncbi:MAG: CPBP family glutamic-type intramembrane protease [Pirellulaceae bacterium]|nr:CPBP family glutamic-type intramembrane protease [Pirellulaceae bacterium]